jgi:predicted nucleotide-binding protein with TIR-like domain
MHSAAGGIDMRTQVFVASASEGKRFAEAIIAAIGNLAKCVPWYQGVFEVGGNTQTSLIKAISECDIVVIVMTADDTMTSRGQTFFSPRDNLVFEAGMSFGINSPGRTIIVPEGKPNFKLPSDLRGFTTTDSFDSNLPPALAVAGAAKQIRDAIRKLGVKGRVVKMFGKPGVVRASKEIISSAGRNIVMMGRDLSWAKDYEPYLREAIIRNIEIDVFCETPTQRYWQSNVDILKQVGANVRFLDKDLTLRLTMVDSHSEDVSRFMIMSKRRSAKGYAYRCEIHDAKESPLLWRTLTGLYESLCTIPIA